MASGLTFSQEEIDVLTEALRVYVRMGVGDFEMLEQHFKEEGRYDGYGNPHREIFLLKEKLLGLRPKTFVPIQRAPEKYALASKLKERFLTCRDRIAKSSGP